MAGLTRRAVVLAKVQSGEGVDAAPVAPLNAMQVSDLSFAMDGQIIERNFLRDSLSRIPHRLGLNRLTSSFGMELKSGPDTGSTPEWLPLLRAGGMTYANTTTVASIRTAAYRWITTGSGTGEFFVELAAGGDPSITLPDGVRENGMDMVRGTAGSLLPGQWDYGTQGGFSTVKVRLTDDADPDSKAVDFVQTTVGGAITLTPRDTGHEYASVYLYPDGLLVKVLDAMNNWSMNFQAGQVATLQNQIQGIFTLPTDVALPTSANYQAHLPPICESMLLTVDGYATGTIQSFALQSGTVISPRPDLNSADGNKGYRYTGRSFSGSITMEQELVATFAAWTKADAATEMALTMNLGSTPQRIQFSATKIQFGNVQSADINGNRAVTIPVMFNENLGTGGKEFIMTLN